MQRALHPGCLGVSVSHLLAHHRSCLVTEAAAAGWRPAVAVQQLQAARHLPSHTGGINQAGSDCRATGSRDAVQPTAAARQRAVQLGLTWQFLFTNDTHILFVPTAIKRGQCEMWMKFHAVQLIY